MVVVIVKKEKDWAISSQVPKKIANLYGEGSTTIETIFLGVE